MFAADLVSALTDFGLRQHVAVLRSAGALDVPYDAPVTRMRSGPEIPGLRLNPIRVFDLARLVRRLRPDVVQAHGGEALKYALAASPRMRIPIVYRRIGSIHGWTRPGLRRSGHGMLTRRASRVITLSCSMYRETVDTLGVPPDRVVLLPNAVDFQRIRASATASIARSTLGIPEAAPLIVWIGSLSDEKNPLAAVAVAGMVASDAVFALVGDGPLAERVRTSIERLGLGGRVRLLGTRSDVGNLLQSCDALLVTSRTEGVPGVIIEAGMHGVPVVSFQVGGVEDVVIHGDTGLLVAPGNLASLASSLTSIIQDAELKKRLGSAARARCSSAFDIQAVAPGYFNVYQELARQRQCSA